MEYIRNEERDHALVRGNLFPLDYKTKRQANLEKYFYPLGLGRCFSFFIDLRSQSIG